MTKAAEDLKEISDIEELYSKRKSKNEKTTKAECPIGSIHIDDNGDMYICYGVLKGHLLWKKVI